MFATSFVQKSGLSFWLWTLPVEFWCLLGVMFKIWAGYSPQNLRFSFAFARFYVHKCPNWLPFATEICCSFWLWNFPVEVDDFVNHQAQTSRLKKISIEFSHSQDVAFRNLGWVFPVKFPGVTFRNLCWGFIAIPVAVSQVFRFITAKFPSGPWHWYGLVFFFYPVEFWCLPSVNFRFLGFFEAAFIIFLNGVSTMVF